MFKLINYMRDEDMCFAVLDTRDYVVEFIDMEGLKLCWSRGITIEGLCKENRITNVRIQKPDIPSKLMTKIQAYLKKTTKTEADFKATQKILIDSFRTQQKAGVNLLQVAETVDFESFRDILY